MFIAENFLQFQSLFVSKLKGMLSNDELGAFILVLANSRQDELLRNELAAETGDVFLKLKEKFSFGKLNATADDSDVFRQLIDAEIDKIPVWKSKSIGVWQVTYNSIRQLRPARISSQVLTSISQSYDEKKFHFNKPFLKPEILWEGEYLKKQLRVLYNKFPFSDYHLLIAVSPEKKQSQLLTQEMHELIYSLSQDCALKFPGFGVGFNSMAAGASVNHLHFQGFIREDDFPIEAGCWRHNGGSQSYPLNVSCFMAAEEAWSYIDQLIKDDVAFNCLYRENGCYVIPRKYQGRVELPEWLEGAGWLDVAGVMTVANEGTYDSIDEHSIEQALNLMFK